MAFRFRLEQILQYKIRLEDEAKQQVAVALKAYEAQKKYTQEMRNAINAEKKRIAQAQQISPDELWLTQQYCAGLSQEIIASEKRERSLAEGLEACRAKLVATAQERKLLEKLREKNLAKYMQEEKLKEQRGYDETATLRAQKTAI